MGLSVIFMVMSIIFSSSYAAVEDFCVADYGAPTSPAGYSCKPLGNVTADDFAYSGLGVAGNTSNMVRGSITIADSANFGGLNGLGLSMARIDLAPGGVVPMHLHPGSSETFFVVEGTLIAAFISADQNKVYMKTIKAGDIWAIPEGLIHFFVNIGDDKPVLAIASYSNARLRIQIVDNTLFGNDIPSQVIANTTFIGISEVRRLKAVFNGTN